jgi:hypothetical protein
MPWNLHLGSENILGTVLAILMVLDAYTAGDRTMEGNFLGSEGTGGSESITVSRPQTALPWKKRRNSEGSSTRLGFFRGGMGRIQS